MHQTTDTQSTLKLDRCRANPHYHSHGYIYPIVFNELSFRDYHDVSRESLAMPSGERCKVSFAVSSACAPIVVPITNTNLDRDLTLWMMGKLPTVLLC
jgi:hypothetical protein